MEYKIITKDRYEDVIHHLREFYFMDEPLNTAVGLCKRGEGNQEYEDYIRKVLADNMSIMAVDENDEAGRIVGVRLNGIISDRDYVELTEKSLELCSDENYKKMEHLFIELNRRANIFDRFNVDNIVNFYMVSVNERFRGKGIAKELISRSLQLMRDRGFKFIKSEATGIYSQNALKSNGFAVLEEEFYDKWCDQFGNPIFKVQSPHISVQLMYKVLD